MRFRDVSILRTCGFHRCDDFTWGGCKRCLTEQIQKLESGKVRKVVSRHRFTVKPFRSSWVSVESFNLSLVVCAYLG